MDQKHAKDWSSRLSRRKELYGSKFGYNNNLLLVHDITLTQ